MIRCFAVFIAMPAMIVAGFGGNHRLSAQAVDQPASQSARAADSKRKEPGDSQAGDDLPTIQSPSVAEIQTAIDRGVKFLITDQNKNGSWGSPTRTKGLNIYAPVPGAHHAFRAATTSLCISALIEIDSPDPDAEKALQQAEAWLMEHIKRLRRA